jgi:ribokinase
MNMPGKGVGHAAGAAGASPAPQTGETAGGPAPASGPSSAPSVQLQVQVVGLGLSTLDVLIRLPDMSAGHRAGRHTGFALDGGGMVGTAMVAVSRLGVRAGYVGTAGTGLAGELKRRFLTDYGVDLRGLQVYQAPEKHIVIVYVDGKTGERSFTGWSEGGQDLRPAELDRSYITGARYLLLDGFHYDSAVLAADWMRQARGKVVFDGGKTTRGEIGARVRALLSKADVLICGSGFAPALTGEKDIVRAGKAALARLAPGAVVVQTEGEQGSWTTTADESFHIPAFAVNVVDTTGCGDVFHGAYLVGLLRGWDLRRTATFASAVSALKCSALGGRAGIPSFPQTMEFLRQRGACLE